MQDFNRRTALAAGLSLTAAGLAPGIAQAVQSTPFPFRMTQNRVWLAVKVNDKGPFAFLVDTAARDYMIDQKLAASLKLTGGESSMALTPGQAGGIPTKAARLKGPVGNSDLPVFQVNSITIAGAFQDRDAVLVGQPPGRFDLAQGVVPSGRVAVLDMNFDRGLARVATAVRANPRGYDRVPILKKNPIQWSHRLYGDRPLVYAKLNGKDVRVLFDTGIADGLFLSPGYVKREKLWDAFPKFQPGRTWTTFGRVPTTRTVIGKSFRVGNIHFENVPMVLGDPADAGDTTNEADVLVGVEVLRRMNFVYDIDRQHVLVQPSGAHDDFWRVDRSGLELVAVGDFVHVASVQKGSPAEAADFRPGDAVKGWIGEGGYFGILWALQDEPGRSIHFQLERDGKELMKPLTLDDWL